MLRLLFEWNLTMYKRQTLKIFFVICMTSMKRIVFLVVTLCLTLKNTPQWLSNSWPLEGSVLLENKLLEEFYFQKKWQKSLRFIGDKHLNDSWTNKRLNWHVCERIHAGTYTWAKKISYTKMFSQGKQVNFHLYAHTYIQLVQKGFFS